MNVKVAEAVADEIRKAGVDRVFGLPGGEVLFFMEALRQVGIEFILCRHEASAGIMASVYGKLKGVPGIVVTTLGPGAANLMLALSNSLLDREPLVAISAQIPSGWPLSHTHQRIPFLDCYRPVTKFAAEVDSFSARRTVQRALEFSLEEPAGPVYLTLSAEDAVAPSYEGPRNERDSLRMPAQQAVGHYQQKNGDFPTDSEKVAERLRQELAASEKPLVLLGLGSRPPIAEKLRMWLADWGIPVAVTPKAKGLVDETQDNFVGVIGGMAIDDVMVDALRSADLLISFGFDPVEVDKTWHAELPILWVLESPLALGVVPQQRLLVADYSHVLERLLESDPPRSWNDPFATFKQRRRDYYEDGNQGTVNLRNNPIAAVRAVAEVLPPDTIVTTDVGSHKYLFGQFWPSRQPETFFMSNGLSGMGYGLPAAIAAKLARPDAPVLAILGDGGFSMVSQELETARRNGAPVIVLVMTDNSYSLIRLGQESRGLPRHGVDFDPIDSVLTAQACGVDGMRVETSDQLARIVEKAAEENRSLVVEVPVDVSAYREIV